MAELLSAFDAVRAEHEGMAAEAFNDDVAYKTGIIQVGGGGATLATQNQGGTVTA